MCALLRERRVGESRVPRLSHLRGGQRGSGEERGSKIVCVSSFGFRERESRPMKSSTGWMRGCVAEACDPTQAPMREKAMSSLLSWRGAGAPGPLGQLCNGWERWLRAGYPRWSESYPRDCCISRAGGGGEDPLGFRGSVGILAWAGQQGQRS